jgi:hypothetical protein
MTVLFAVVGLLVLIAGGAGLFITYTNYSAGSLDWIEGNLIYGVFLVIGLATIIVLTLTPRRE